MSTTTENGAFSYANAGLLKNMSTNTENGALSHTGTGSATLDLFFKTVRNTPESSLTDMLSRSWAESPLDTLKAIFHLRDCRGGKGERKQFHSCLRWLISSGNSKHLLANLEHIPFYGTYRDMFALCGTEAELPMLKLYAGQLRTDLDEYNKAKNSGSINAEGHVNASVSLAAKWAPSEGSSLDKKHNLVRKLMGLLRKSVTPTSTSVINSAEYRKNLITPLRAHLGIVERQMCARDWSTIDFETVPSVAMKQYRKAFQKHQEERFQQYLADVKSGKAKINASQVYPHQLVEHYLNGGKYDETIEAQWKALVSEAREKYAAAGQSALSIVDVSGSMSGTPMNVAIALGLLLSEIASGPFAGKILTFSEVPTFFYVNLKDSLRDKVQALQVMDWNMTTNLQKAFDLILNAAIMFSVPAAQMPRTLYIFSDMQFDLACPDNHRTNFQAIEQKYRIAGYERPNIVFWNLRGDTVDFPIEKDVPQTALVSGFSQSILSIFMDGKVVSPYAAMRVALDNPRYARIGLAN